MSVFERINERISTIEKIKQQKEAISKGLKIVWETDPAKMEFEKLRSYNFDKRLFDLEILRVMEYSIVEQPYQDIFVGDNQSHVEMIDILMNGGKLIPPVTTEAYVIVDGEEKLIGPADGIIDGSHRINLAKYFGLDTVPVVVFKLLQEYWFTSDKWTFEGPRIREEQQTPGGFSYIEYNGVRATSKDGKVYTFRGSDVIVDSSNTEYLVIITPNKNHVNAK